MASTKLGSNEPIDANEVNLLLHHPNFSHTRAGDRCWRGLVYIYHRDKTSPSGVSLAGTTDEPTFELLKGNKPAPLSPTEFYR